MESKDLFLKTAPLRLFFIAAIPGAVSMLASMLYGLFDGIFVGQFLGETAFAAINLAFPFVILNFSLADLIGVGSAVPISISLGKKQEKEANNVFTCAVLMICGMGVLMGALLYFTSPLLIGLMGAEGELASQAVEYVRVYAVCSPVTTIVFALDNYLRISGKIRFSMFLNIMMSVLTLVLEFVFLFVLHMGIGGAALAACAGMMIAAAVAIVPLALGKLQLKFCRPRFTVAIVKETVACGMPIFLSNIAGRITSIVMNSALLHMGGESAVSVYGILMYVGETIQPIVYGICDSLQPAIGYNRGAGRYDRVYTLRRYCFTAAAIVSAVAAGVMLFFPRTMASLFISDMTPEFMETVVFALRIYATSRLTQWFCFATQSYMIAVEKPLYATILSTATSLVLPMIAIVLLYPLHLTGLWLNATFTMTVAVIPSVILLVINHRKEQSEIQALRKKMSN